MCDKNVDCVVLIELDFIVWLFNICGLDVFCLFVLFFYVIVYNDSSVDFFFDLVCLVIDFDVYVVGMVCVYYLD